VVIFEIAYLHEKKRIPISVKDIENIIADSVNYVEEALTLDIIKSAFEITDIPELHDRLIAGTARHLDIPLITNDPVILNSTFLKCIK
jgi:PIN domain nuclease of toxin-antitoxin system